MTLPVWLPWVIGALFVFGVWQAWRQQSGTTPEARLKSLEEELEALREEHARTEARVRALERRTEP